MEEKKKFSLTLEAKEVAFAFIVLGVIAFIAPAIAFFICIVIGGSLLLIWRMDSKKEEEARKKEADKIAEARAVS